jgi:hypothetical protein
MMVASPRVSGRPASKDLHVQHAEVHEATLCWNLHTSSYVMDWMRLV